MVETIGKKLCQARLARGLSIEEAAHETRVRPDKLLALENDDYGRFGSNAYAKGFLQLYGRFLNVDVSETLPLLETPREVTISDYQYLNNAAAAEPVTQRAQVRRTPRGNKPSVVPLIIMLGVMVLGAGAYVTYLVDVTSKRLEPDQSLKVANSEEPAPGQITTSAQPAGATQPGAQAPFAPAPRATQPQLAPQTPTPVAFPGDAEILRAEPVNPAAVSAAPAPRINELVVEPIKKTWVKVRQDGPPATFEDYVYPGAKPLTLRGSSFYVEVQDQDAVQIRMNGHPIAYTAPGISIR